jgi:hypothetical protein
MRQLFLLFSGSKVNTIFESNFNVEAGADVNLRGVFEPEEDFALNLAAFCQNKEIYDYLAPLTSEELRAIAEKTWNL